jgi:DNA primase
LNKIFKLTREVVFCFDGDRAGRQAAWRALENSLPVAIDGREFKFMFLPDGHDPDTLIAEEGANAFETRLKSALPLSEYLVQQLMADVDLAHPDGRATLKALVAPLFARMPEGIYREMLVERLAARVSMPAKALRESFSTGQPRATPGAFAEPRSGHRGRNSHGRGNLLSQAITWVVHHPGAAGAVVSPAAFAQLEVPGVSVLRELLAQAAAMPNPSTAMLLERWRGRPEYGRLTELAMSEPMVEDTAGAAQELQMAIEKLLETYGPGRRMDELLRKAEELGLNYDEKAELSLLLKTKGRPRPPSH